ncbi:unnamed protein product [Oikopleura dioica]|uniref:Uncharacterized protein n=1 Tax=Oikopleura dioica TaxID=34765 RepID=E4XXS1_OIKDI|nr:unnamed protein product [Oikopleura dioica]CBY41309.1 unnamed protein product [Oikopleura dioica]
MGFLKKLKPSRDFQSEQINDKFRLDQISEEDELGSMEEFFEEDPTIFEDIQEDEVFDRQMALREVTKDFEKSDEYFKRISMHSIAASKSRSATRSSLNGEKVSLPSVLDGSMKSEQSRNKSLINNVLADIVKTRRADEKKRRNTTQRMSVASQSRLSNAVLPPPEMR